MSTWRVAIAGGVTVAATVLVVPFFAATTFLGDDHLFLTFARHAPNPLVAFVSDAHGGEYYRPLSMLVWWLLGRAGGGTIPFAILALVLHAAVAMLVTTMLRALGRPRGVATLAGGLMLFAPQNLEAAYWFSASTDLLATLFVLAGLVALVGGHPILGALASLGGFLSKETAFVFPLLVLVVVGGPWRRRLIIAAPSAGLAAFVLATRRAVLGGAGGSPEAVAGLGVKAVQIAGGLARVFVGEAGVPAPLALAIGATLVGLAALASVRRQEARWRPWAFAAIGVLPLGAAGWVVGARYFYMPAVGLAWALAEALSGAGGSVSATPPVALTVAAVVALLGLDAGRAVSRRPDVSSYDRRVAAARRAVVAGVAAGHRVFHVDGGIKDLDLVIKEDPALQGLAGSILVLNDVPASFAIVPPDLAEQASIVVAEPSIPPAGAYRFGDVRVVGLARRGDEPTLDEVVARFPDIRFLRLRLTPAGHVIARDLTAEVQQRLDGAVDGGQN